MLNWEGTVWYMILFTIWGNLQWIFSISPHIKRLYDHDVYLEVSQQYNRTVHWIGSYFTDDVRKRKKGSNTVPLVDVN